MARLKIEEVIYELSGEIRGALNEAVKSVIPSVEVNPDDMFREFMKAIHRHCNIWERVPSKYVVLDELDIKVNRRTSRPKEKT